MKWPQSSISSTLMSSAWPSWPFTTSVERKLSWLPNSNRVGTVSRGAASPLKASATARM